MKKSSPHLLNHIIASLAITVLIQGCITSVDLQDWPTNIPARKTFVEAWQRQRIAGSNHNSKEEHLVWIIRFYEGSILYPIGWNHMTEQVLQSLENHPHQSDVQNRLFQLGKIISIEWAQDNSARKINSAAIAVWGNALRTSVEREEQVEFISKIEQDVEALLNAQISVDEIRRERYYPAEDYDNF